MSEPVPGPCCQVFEEEPETYSTSQLILEMGMPAIILVFSTGLRLHHDLQHFLEITAASQRVAIQVLYVDVSSSDLHSDLNRIENIELWHA